MSLHDMMKDPKIKFSFTDICKIIFDLLNALIELRSHNIIHSDIKPGNILVNKRGDYLMTDLGASKKMD